MKISVEMGVSESHNQESFDLIDLGYNETEWEELSETKKNEVIQNEVNNLPSQPFWVVESFEEK